MNFWYWFGRCVIGWMMRVFGRIEVVGIENVPLKGPLIVAPNHQSNADPPLLAAVLDRPVWFMGKRGLFKHRVLGFFLRRFHVYPVDRTGRDIRALRWCLGLLAQGSVMVVFPEGTRRPGSLGIGTHGAAYLALKSGTPIIPVGITGTEHITGFFRIGFPFRRLRVVIGRPYTVAGGIGRLSNDMLGEFTADLMSHIAALLPPEYRGAHQV